MNERVPSDALYGRKEAEHDLAELLRSEGPTVWRALYAFTGGRREIAHDALAEAFARAVTHAAEIREPLGWSTG